MHEIQLVRLTYPLRDAWSEGTPEIIPYMLVWIVICCNIFFDNMINDVLKDLKTECLKLVFTFSGSFFRNTWCVFRNTEHNVWKLKFSVAMFWIILKDVLKPLRFRNTVRRFWNHLPLQFLDLPKHVYFDILSDT